MRDVPASELARLGREMEGLGYRDLFVPDVRGAAQDSPVLSGRDAFTSLGAVFEATTTLRATVGVAAIIFHRLSALALTASTLNEQSGGRFTLGVGISHAEAARQAGVEFPTSPLATMTSWVAELRQRSSSGMAFGGGWPLLVGSAGAQDDRARGRAGRWCGPELAHHRAPRKPSTKPKPQPKPAAAPDALSSTYV